MENAIYQITALMQLAHNYKMVLIRVDGTIEGSYWGENEAGLIGKRLIIRDDTPLHSALHEACHYICMDGARRSKLHTDAGGTDQEENAVCYLQILLADQFEDYGREQIMKEMDSWGYSFRLGSAKSWFEDDAEDAREFLLEHKLITANDQVILGAVRQ